MRIQIFQIGGDQPIPGVQIPQAIAEMSRCSIRTQKVFASMEKRLGRDRRIVFTLW